MDKNINKNTRAILWNIKIRWIARFLGTTCAVYAVFSTVAGLIRIGNLTAWDFLAYGSTAFFIIFVVGVIVAWFREKIGGIILVANAVAASIFGIIFGIRTDSDLSMLIFFAVCFLIIGIVFLVYWWKSRNLSASQ